MCGIAGIVLHPAKTIEDLVQRLHTIRDTMYHRGPDDAGIWLTDDHRVGLATRRLAIRDLSPAGRMPMTAEAEQVAITYNGEIYNANELRAELTQLGYHFKSHSDTEVILLGYVAWGCAIIQRLRGMFAFALLDRRPSPDRPSGRLLLARDPMGIKPLYYARTSSGMVFASEIKAMLKSGLISGDVSPAGLVGYLMLGSVPNPYTIYRDIQALPPATFVDLDLCQPGDIWPVTYWELPHQPSCVARTRAEAVELVRERLFDAVRVRLVRDVPLGAFLSGGLDSSAVVALMRQATNNPLRTCSMAFEEAEYSEASYARAVAEHVEAEHFERVVTADDVLTEFDAIIAAMDQPSVDGVNTYFVSQTARQAGLTVALSGLGGDELFAGYPNTFHQAPQVYHALRLTQRVSGASALARTMLNLVPQHTQWQRVADALAQPTTPASAYLTRRGLFAPSEVHRLLDPDLYAEGCRTLDAVQHVTMQAGGTDNGNGKMSPHWISRAELRTYTHNQLLRDTDVMSMAHSLEVRVPLLDTKLVETMLSLPTEHLFAPSRQPKPLLADAVGYLLPVTVRQRTDKRGFTFPFDRWLRSSLADRTRQVLAAVEHKGWLQPGTVDSVYDSYRAGKTHWSRVWALTALASCHSEQVKIA